MEELFIGGFLSSRKINSPQRCVQCGCPIVETPTEFYEPTVKAIQQAVADWSHTSVFDIVSHRQWRPPGSSVGPRLVAYWLASVLTHHGNTAIGRFFGHRDHSTIARGIATVDKILRDGGEEAQAILALRDRLASPQ